MNIKAKATTNGTFGGTRSALSSSSSNTVALAPEVTSGQNAQSISNSSDSSLLSDYTDYVEQAHDYDVEYRDWSANEAQKARDFTEEMSNTSYQRAVKDMIAAGLNPALAYKLGGADTGSAASASSGGSNTASSLLGTAISSAVSSAIASENRQSNKEIAYLNGYFNQNVANTYAGATVASAKIGADASKYVSDNHLRGTIYQADSALEGSKYSTDGAIYSSVYQADSAYDRENMKGALEIYMHQFYPESSWQLISATINDLSNAVAGDWDKSTTFGDIFIKNAGIIDSAYGKLKK